MVKEKQPMYDAVVVFDVPVEIANDRGERIYIFGLLYDKTLKHKDDLWTWELNRYLCYLQGCQTVQTNNGKLAPELWITPDEQLIALKVETKNYIYRIMRERMQGYRVVEYDQPLDLKPEEHEDLFVISKEPLVRYHLTDDKNKKKNK